MTRTKHHLPLTLFTAASMLLIVGCSSNNEEAQIDPAAPVATTPAPPPPAEPQPAKINAPLTAEQIKVEVNVVDSPRYDAARDQLSVRVAVRNVGPVVMPVRGGQQVVLGIVQKIAAAPDQPDKRAAESRAAFSQDISPGQTVEADAVFPADWIVGNKVEFDVLQEQVLWFGLSMKQPTATIGPFTRCGTGLCDEKGAPIPAL